MATFTNEVKPRLAKPPLNLSGSLAKLRLTPLSNNATGDMPNTFEISRSHLTLHIQHNTTARKLEFSSDHELEQILHIRHYLALMGELSRPYGWAIGLSWWVLWIEYCCEHIIIRIFLLPSHRAWLSKCDRHFHRPQCGMQSGWY